MNSKPKRIYWNDDEITVVANEFKRRFPGGEPLLWRLRDAQAVLPTDRRKTIIGPATLRALRCAIEGKPIPPRVMGRAAAKHNKRDSVHESPPVRAGRPRRQPMITRQAVNAAIMPQPPAGATLAGEIISALLKANIAALHQAAEQLSVLEKQFNLRSVAA